VNRADLLDWLRARKPERPAELASRMDEVVSLTDEAALAAVPTVAEAMALMGVDLLARVAGSPDPRANGLALDLLAADAFVTYAFEAASEQGVELKPLVSRLLAEVA
jgi:MoxR-like ATPase